LTLMSFNFEHGGKDLASLRNATNMFIVAINLPDVQERIWAHAASALDYLQNKEIIKHCDFKPHNILLSSNHQTLRLRPCPQHERCCHRSRHALLHRPRISS
jgi:serine/threonine protein kinase